MLHINEKLLSSCTPIVILCNNNQPIVGVHAEWCVCVCVCVRVCMNILYKISNIHHIDSIILIGYRFFRFENSLTVKEMTPLRKKDVRS